jgi:hypothetical protein
MSAQGQPGLSGVSVCLISRLTIYAQSNKKKGKQKSKIVVQSALFATPVASVDGASRLYSLRMALGCRSA